MSARRALIIGHFSTVGDLEVLNVVRSHLDRLSIPYDVAPYSRQIASQVGGWIDPRRALSSNYTHLFAVCGPIYRAYLVRQGIDLDRFRHCVRIAVNVTLVDPVSEWNPFDFVLGRDSDQWMSCDISFLHETPRVPVIGLCFVGRQKEYGDRQKHDRAQDLLRRAALRSGMAVLDLDTEWPGARPGLSSPSQFESLCSRLDVLLTTRLHGLCLSLKNGVPVVAVDGIAGGDKLSKQARSLGWPEIFSVDNATDDAIDAALRRCLTDEASRLARDCTERAHVQLSSFPDELARAIDGKPSGKPSFTELQKRAKSRRGTKSLSARILNFLRG